MPKQLTGKKLAALRRQLQDAHHLDAGQRQALHNEVDALERQLEAQIPPDAATLEARLQEWEARMAVEHPLLASVITDALQKLSSMGI
jgi:diadenosine tetraphosphate (Ap4A) HIT family hydrolase